MVECSLSTQDLKQSISIAANLLDDLDTDDITIEVKKNKAIFTAKSESCWLKNTIPAQGKKDGILSTDFSILSATKFKGNTVTLKTVKDSKVMFKCGRLSGDISSKSTKGFDMTPHHKIKLTHKFPTKTLTHLFETLTYDADVVEVVGAKPVRFVFNGKKFSASTNDSYTFGYIEEKDSMKNKGKIEAILPGDVMSNLLNTIKEDAVEFGFSDSFVRFKTESFDLVHAYLPPDADKLVDIESALKELKKMKAVYSFEISSQSISEVLDEIASFSNSNSEDGRVTLEFDSKKKKCNVLFTMSYGKVKSSFDLVSANKSLKIKYSLHMLSNVLKQMKGDIKMNVLSDQRTLLLDDAGMTFGLSPLA